MLLGGRAGNLLVLTTVLISFISGDKKDCTPETQLPVQYIKCEYSTETADCPASSIGSAGTPLETVNDISVYKYLNTSNNYTGVKISWSSPSATSLNATVGYLVRLYYNLTNGNRVLLLCRHFKIRYTREIVRTWEADYKFVLLESSLPLYKTVIQIELESLPSNSIGYAPSLATSQFITLGNPLDRFNMNGSADSGTPFAVTVRFKKSTYDPDTNVLYNHTYFLVSLSQLDRGYITDIGGKYVMERYTYPNQSSEYAAETFTGLRPSEYLVEVWPWREAKCLVTCRNVTDSRQISHWNVKVIGYDYTETPKLILSMDDKVVVSFQIAPSYLFIDRYKVILRQDGQSDLMREVTANQSDVWYTHNFTFSTVEVVKTFNLVTETVTAKVIPVVNPDLCSEPGQCNLNGTCTPCTESVSLPLELSDLQKNVLGYIDSLNEQPPESNQSATIALVVVLSLFIPTLLGISVYMMYKRYCFSCSHRDVPKDNAPVPADDGESLVTFTPFDGHSLSVMMFGPVTVKTCVAFAAGPLSIKQYHTLYRTMSKIMTDYFSCPLSLYSEVSRRNSSEFRGYDIVLILCTPELYEMHKKLESSSPNEMRQEEMEHSRVRDLLFTPHNVQNPTRIMVTFDHIPTHYVEELAATNSDKKLDVFNLSTDLEQLVTAMYTRGMNQGNAKVTTWAEFKTKGKPLAERLSRNINDLATTYKQIQDNLDSGYAETMTITTYQQVMERAGSSEQSQQRQVQQQAENQQPLRERQQQDIRQQRENRQPRNESLAPAQQPASSEGPELAENGERLATLTQPVADEMVYLRENSADIPPHLRRQIQQAHLDAESVYTVDSILPDSVSMIHRNPPTSANTPLVNHDSVTSKNPEISNLGEHINHYIANSRENTAPMNHHIANSRVNTAPMNHHITNSRENTAPIGHHIANSREDITPMNHHIATSREDTAPINHHIATSRENTAPMNHHIANSRENTAPVNHHMATSRENTAPMNHHIVVTSDNITPANSRTSINRETHYIHPDLSGEAQPLVSTSAHPMHTAGPYDTEFSVGSDDFSELSTVSHPGHFISSQGKPVLSRNYC